jgi:hypothetical protein
MRLRINPWVFLGKLVVLFAVTYLLWTPLAPAYTQILLRASRVGVWLTELSSDPRWHAGTSLRAGQPCIGPPHKSARGCGQYCSSSADCPQGIECVGGICQLTCATTNDCRTLCGEQSNCLEAPGAPIFYNHRNFAAMNPQIPPRHIPAEWVMANLLLLVPLMLATPAPSWRARFSRLALALAIALLLQVIDVIVGIKSSYAATFQGYWSPWAAKTYQFLDAFFQSWDTQLFPFAIWAGIHFKQILGSRLHPGAPEEPITPPSGKGRAERRRSRKKR